MKTALQIVLPALAVYFAFVFVKLSFDITTWSEEARFFCMMFSLVSMLPLPMISYLEGGSKPKKPRYR